MKDNVIDTIKTSGVKMRSRRYFVLRTILAIIGAIVLLFMLLFAITFILFVLHENGGFFAANFGIVGWAVLFEALPWSICLLAVALLLVLWLLIRRYPIIYHHPLLYTFLFLVIIFSLFAVFLSPNAIHGGIFRYVSRNPVPFVTGVYEFETAPANDMYRGQVVFLATSSFILGDALGQTSTVFIIPAASSELKQISPGDYIIIFGHAVATATIEANGIEKIVDYQ